MSEFSLWFFYFACKCILLAYLVDLAKYTVKNRVSLNFEVWKTLANYADNTRIYQGLGIIA